MLPVDELFDFVVDSCVVGTRKPDYEIFHIALQQLEGVAAEQTVFLDDFEANVETARALGMQGIHVTEDVQQAIDALQLTARVPLNN